MRSAMYLMLVGLAALAGLAMAASDPAANAPTAAKPAVDHAAHAHDAAPAAAAVDHAAHAHDAAPAAAAVDHAAHAHGGHGEGQALLPIMQRLGAEMLTMTFGLMTDDAAKVARSAAAIATHVPIAPDELERIRGVLGEEMAEFVRLDEAVHADSMRLHDAAKDGDPASVLARMNEVQAGCIACHARFRARLLTTPAP